MTDGPKTDIPSYAIDHDGVRAHQLGAYLRRAGHHATVPHRHQFWQCIYWTAGQGEHHVDLCMHRYEPGSVLILPPLAVHAFTDDEAEGILLHFDEDHLVQSPQDAALVLTLKTVTNTEPLIKSSSALVEVMQWLVREAQLDDLAMQRNLLHVLMRLYLRNSDVMRLPDDYVRFLERVEQRYQAHDSIADYAQALNLTTKKLYALTQKIAGLPPGQLITRRLLLEATRLIVHSDQSIAAIGYALGFDDPAYFSRFFRKHKAMSPRTYRQQKRQGKLSKF